MNYQVKINDSGGGGTIRYSENDQELPFDWEFAMNGALLFVPAPQFWNNFCARNNLPQACDRRDEILKSVSEEVIRQKSPGGKYEIGDAFISISFG